MATVAMVFIRRGISGSFLQALEIVSKDCESALLEEKSTWNPWSKKKSEYKDVHTWCHHHLALCSFYEHLKLSRVGGRVPTQDCSILQAVVDTFADICIRHNHGFCHEAVNF